jgi:hypothetical protein
MQVNAKIKTIDVILAHNGDLYAENHNGGTALHEGFIFIFVKLFFLKNNFIRGSIFFY